MPGSAILIGGHPGAGKSTLLLQVMCGLAKKYAALYVTGEESLQQVAMRANRLNLPTDKLNMLSETSVEQICNFGGSIKTANYRSGLDSGYASFGYSILSRKCGTSA